MRDLPQSGDVLQTCVVQLSSNLMTWHNNGHPGTWLFSTAAEYVVPSNDLPSYLTVLAGMDQTPGSKDESLVAESQRLGEEVDVERRVQLLISFTTQVVFGYVAQVKCAVCFCT